MEWNTGRRPRNDGAYAYTIMIRAPDDPERCLKKQIDVFPHHTIARMDLTDLKAGILWHLMDGTPRTLNRLGVEMWDRPGDITGGTKVEETLWLLVEEMELEHTMEAPILFRRRGTLKLF